MPTVEIPEDTLRSIGELVDYLASQESNFNDAVRDGDLEPDDPEGKHIYTHVCRVESWLLSLPQDRP